MVVGAAESACPGFRSGGFPARTAMGAPADHLLVRQSRPMGIGFAFGYFRLVVLPRDGLGDPAQAELGETPAAVGIHRVIFRLAIGFLGALDALPDADLSCPGVVRRVGFGETYFCQAAHQSLVPQAQAEVDPNHGDFVDHNRGPHNGRLGLCLQPDLHPSADKGCGQPLDIPEHPRGIDPGYSNRYG